MTLRDLMHRDRTPSSSYLNRDKLSRSLSGLQSEMNRLFQEFFAQAGQWTAEWGKFSPSIDVLENERDFSVRAEVPGFDPDRVEVSVTDGFLRIRGERMDERDERNENYLRRESAWGSFERVIALPETAHLEKAEATFKHGMLYVSVPKKAEALQKSKKIEIRKVA